MALKSGNPFKSSSVQHVYGHGKLMISGEYTALDDGLCLAVPTRFGQHFFLEQNKSPYGHLDWFALEKNGVCWLEERFRFGDSNESLKIKPFIDAVLKLNPGAIEILNGSRITSYCEFDRSWGLGSSSTLIHCLATLTQIDPLDLLSATIGGSGYDVICAGQSALILYRKSAGVYKRPRLEDTVWNRVFLIHRNQKAKTSSAIEHYRSIDTETRTKSIKTINDLSEAIAKAHEMDELITLLAKHEVEISKLINQKTVQQELFRDFNGVVKSLGAWGGDFVLAASASLKEEDIYHYFRKKDHKTIFKFSEIAL